MAKKDAAQKRAAKDSSSAAVEETASEAGAEQQVDPAREVQKAERAKSPDGWVKLPLELRPFWSPLHSKRPLEGILIAQSRLEVENLPVLCVRLTAATDIVLPGGQLGEAKAGQEVLVPRFYALSAIAQLLSRDDIYYQVWIGNPEKVDLGSTDLLDSARLWSIESVVNPQGIPRTAAAANK